MRKRLEPAPKAPVRVLYVRIDAAIAQQFEKLVDRPSGKTWRAWLELMMQRVLREERESRQEK